MTVRNWQVWLYNANILSSQLGSTANVDTIFTVSDLSGPPTIPGPAMDPLEGKAVGQPWTINVLDSTGKASAILADASGRPDILSRFAQILESNDGSTYTAVGGGRLTAVTDTVPGYDLTFQQESMVGYHTKIFTTNDTHLYPPGAVRGSWRGSTATGVAAVVTTLRQSTVDAHWWQVAMHSPGQYPAQHSAITAIENDMASPPNTNSTESPFDHVQLRVAGTDYPVKSFGTIIDASVPSVPTFRPALQGVEVVGRTMWDNHQQRGHNVHCWVLATTNAFTVGATLGQGVLHMFGAPPSEATPLHVGYSSSGNALTAARAKSNPHRIAFDVINGVYDSSTETSTPFHSTAAFDDGSTGLFYLPVPGFRHRITAPQTRGRWLEENYFKPCRVLPMPTSDGTITHRHIGIPHNTDLTTTSIFAFTSTNLREPFPTWNHDQVEQVTAITHRYPRQDIPGSAPEGRFHSESDLWRVRDEGTTEYLHDRSTVFGRFTMDLHVGLRSSDGSMATYFPSEFFDQYGDGAVTGELYAMESASTVAAGDRVSVTLAGRPNMGTAARGGTRLVTLLSKTKEPNGYVFPFIELGPQSAALSAPTLGFAKSTADGYHTVVATIGSVATAPGGGYEYALASGSSLPAEGSDDWTLMRRFATSEVVTRGGRPSGIKAFGRVRNVAPNRVRSPWTVSTGGVTMNTLAAPTSFAAGSLRATRALLTWGSTNPGYPYYVYEDQSTSASASTANQIADLPAGTFRLQLNGLSGNTKSLVMVRHHDWYGGLGTVTSTTFTSLSTVASTANLDQAPPIGGLHIIHGAST